MSGQAAMKCPDDHPLMIGWTSYQQTEDFKNTLRWTVENIVITTEATVPEANRVNPEDARKRRAMGSLWAAYMAGFNAATERAASLHEQINPASDDERHSKTPGAGAMGAVIEYRDAIRNAGAQ